ncbi:MAG: hypothetical protein WA183_10085 [Chthoniobacterales bacterium]
MLALIPELRKKITSALLLVTAAMLASCATQKDTPRLVDDPDDHHESMMPWNKQEKWETGGQFENMTDRR